MYRLLCLFSLSSDYKYIKIITSKSSRCTTATVTGYSVHEAHAALCGAIPTDVSAYSRTLAAPSTPHYVICDARALSVL